MSEKKTPARITASVTIDGPADEILAGLRQMRGGERRVFLHVSVSTRYYSQSDHFLPIIKNGSIQGALEKLEAMSKQTVLDDATDRRLEQLIRDFGDLTK